jgi:thiol-disulfide isomerase/thioredoxin
MNIAQYFLVSPAFLLGFACATLPEPALDKRSLEFHLKDLKGHGHELATYTGQVVLLDIWASWCPPCKEALPFYAELQERYREHGFSVIAASVDEDRQALEAFVASFYPTGDLPFVILHDQNATLAKQVRMDAMPTSVLIDRSGKTLSIHAGFDPSSDPAIIDAMIRKALGL